MADKIVVMHDGLVEQIGAPLELYDRPDNLFVAGFIGSPAMNFVHGTIRANGVASFRRARQACSLPLATAPAGADGRAAVYGIRPEHFTLADDGAEAEVQVVEPTGSETQVVAARRSRYRRGVPRAPPFEAGRQDPAQTRSAARPSVRRGDRATNLTRPQRRR